MINKTVADGIKWSTTLSEQSQQWSLAQIMLQRSSEKSVSHLQIWILVSVRTVAEIFPFQIYYDVSSIL